MVDFFLKLFDTSDFPARWYCGNWTSELGWLHILSDFATFTAYVAIPITLLLFLRKHDGVAFPRVVWLFAAFIFACGSTHLIEAIIFWHPVYRFAGVMKCITATVSWATVIAVIRVAPIAIRMPGIVAWNNELQREVKAREEAEQRLTAILSSMSDGVMVADTEGNFEMMNPAAISILRFDESDLNVKERFGRYSLYENGSTTKLTGDDLPLRRAAMGATLNQTEIRVCCPERDVDATVKLSICPIRDHDGTHSGAVAVFHDISESKLIEQERHENLLLLKRTTNAASLVAEALQKDNIGDDLLLQVIADEFDATHVILVNRHDERRMKLRTLEANGESTFVMQQTVATETLQAIPTDMLSESAIAVPFLEFAGSSVRNAAIGGLPEHGSITGALIVSRQAAFTELDLDVLHRLSRMIATAVSTKANAAAERQARVQAETQLIESRKQLDKLSRMNSVGEMTAGIAHELNQPLTALINYTDAAHELATELSLAGECNRLMELTQKCNDQAIRASKVLRSVRKMIRQESASFEDVSLIETIRETCVLLDDDIRVAGAKMDLLDAENDIVIQADQTQVQQVLVNLIRNALASVRGCKQRMVYISTSVKDGFAIIKVTDTGRGFSEDEQERLFNAFFSTTESGLGLGLKICRSIAELHGGSIRAERNPSIGATFVVEFPIKQVSAGAYLERIPE